MKKIALILLLFLLPLYLVPPTSAAYGDESSESITSFSETLPDDVLYYPDFDLEANVSTTTEYIDNMESVTYWDAGGKDWDTWESADGNLHSRHDSVGANEYPLRHMDWDDNDDPDPRPEVTEYDDTTYSWYLRFKVDYNDSADYFRIGFYDTPWGGTLEWFSLLTYSKNVWHYVAYDPTTTMTDLDRIDVNAQLDNGEYAELWLDWIAVIPTANNLDPSFSYDNTSYREGFNDVSEWTNVGNGQITTDGDVANLTCTGGSYGVLEHGDAEGFVNLTNTNGLYIEHRFFEIGGGGSRGFLVRLYYDDGDGEETLDFPTWTISVGTYRSYINIEAGAVIYKIRLYIKTVGDYAIVDYLRINPTNESGGWQHDGSTIVGITEQAGITVSSDGDLLNVSSTDAFEFFSVFTDITTTKAYVDPDYYPFLHLRFTADSIGERFAMYLVYTGGSNAIQPETSIAQQDYYFNMRAVTANDIQSLNIYAFSAYDPYYIEFIKMYSIANWTTAQAGGVTTLDVMYVNDDSDLVFDRTTVNWFGVYHAGFSVDTDTYTVWNITTPDIDSRGEAGSTNNFQVTGGWGTENNVDITRGTYPSGTLTHIAIINYGDTIISEIKFIDTRDWQEIGEVEFVIPVGWDPTFIFGYDAFFIFLGLIMIPVSTMYLVRGGREEMSADKLFYGLIIFAVGFGLLVGGIMP